MALSLVPKPTMRPSKIARTPPPIPFVGHASNPGAMVHGTVRLTPDDPPQVRVMMVIACESYLSSLRRRALLILFWFSRRRCRPMEAGGCHRRRSAATRQGVLWNLGRVRAHEAQRELIGLEESWTHADMPYSLVDRSTTGRRDEATWMLVLTRDHCQERMG